MRRTLLLAALFLAGCHSAEKPMKHDHAMNQDHAKMFAVKPDGLDWKMNPAGLPPGAKMAVLEGDPSKPEFFTIRAWLPDGYKVPPHWHPGQERVTVLQGTFNLGEGDVFHESKATMYPPGSYTSMPPGMHHFAFAKGETIIQVSTIGPWGITYVNPADDPRNAPNAPDAK